MPTKKTLKTEALNEEIVFTFKDEEFVLPPHTTWPLDALEAYEEGKILKLLKAVFGDEQYGRIKNVCANWPELNEFVVAAFQAAGVDPKD